MQNISCHTAHGMMTLTPTMDGVEMCNLPLLFALLSLLISQDQQLLKVTMVRMPMQRRMQVVLAAMLTGALVQKVFSQTLLCLVLEIIHAALVATIREL